MAVELNALRDQIDAVDKQMLELLAQRLALVEKVGEVKSEHGLPIYAPDREAAMLASRRAEAEKKWEFLHSLLKIFCVEQCVSLMPARKIPVLSV